MRAKFEDHTILQNAIRLDHFDKLPDTVTVSNVLLFLEFSMSEEIQRAITVRER